MLLLLLEDLKNLRRVESNESFGGGDFDPVDGDLLSEGIERKRESERASERGRKTTRTKSPSSRRQFESR